MNSCGLWVCLQNAAGAMSRRAPAHTAATGPAISEALRWLHYFALHCTNLEKSSFLPFAVLGPGQRFASHARGERQRKCALDQPEQPSHPNPTRVVTYDRSCAHLMIGLKGQNNRAQSNALGFRATALGVQSPIAPTPVSAIEIDLHILCDGFPDLAISPTRKPEIFSGL